MMPKQALLVTMEMSKKKTKPALKKQLAINMDGLFFMIRSSCKKTIF